MRCAEVCTESTLMCPKHEKEEKYRKKGKFGKKVFTIVLNLVILLAIVFFNKVYIDYLRVH